jgi:LacI family transcriptional regulator, gluconate utilization system Gnt-I transcriptional repressor
MAKVETGSSLPDGNGAPSPTWRSRAMPTMDDVAKASGFSQMTVSRAFHGAAPIRKETRERILSVATAIGYYPNRAASSLASQRTRTFGIILPTLQDSIYLPFVEGARRVFEANNSDYLLQSIDYAKGRESHAIASLLAHRVEAILLPSIGHSAATGRFLRSIPIPLIEVGNLPKKPMEFAVGHSDFEAGYLATRRLIEGGRRRVAIICGELRTTTNARDRFNGYRLAMHEAGFETPEDRVAQVEHSVDAGLEGLERLRRTRRAFDGLVIAGEIWSAAVLLHILRSGKQVPKDIAIVGVGKVEIGPYLPVPLTYVDIPRRETGARSAELAIALSQGRPVESRIQKLPTELIPMASG